MAFYRVTYHESYRFATLHNYGCTFRCPFCSYKLKSGAEGVPGHAFPRPERFLKTGELKQVLKELAPERIYFMGGEPTVAPDLEELLRFAKEELGAVTRLGHTNGSRLPLSNLDGGNVGFKAWSGELHRRLTGKPKELIYNNFKAACDAGLDMAANMIYIPELVELEEFEGLLGFLSGISPDIPFHIMGYIPVPGESWRRPEQEEMEKAAALCRSYLNQVDYSHLTSEEARDLSNRDDRFRVKIVAGV